MKKVINGALYDTDTARCLGKITANFSPNSYGYWVHALHRTKSGNYFLYTSTLAVEGDADLGVSPLYQEAIHPLDENAARDWAVDNLGSTFAVDFIAAGTATAHLDVNIPAPIMDALAKKTTELNCSRAQITAQALWEFLQKDDAYRKTNVRPAGLWWNDHNTELVEIGGTVYALHGWNGEEYGSCWICSGSALTEASTETFTLRPIRRFEEENIDIEALEENSRPWDRAMEIVDYDISKN